MHVRKIAAFLKASLLLTRPKGELDDPLATRGDVQVMIGIIQTRILPEIEVILASPQLFDTSAAKLVEDARMLLADVLLDVLCLAGAKAVHQVEELLRIWWTDDSKHLGWKSVLDQVLSATVCT